MAANIAKLPGLLNEEVTQDRTMKRARGTRPKAGVRSERITLHLDHAQLSALDAWIAHQQASPSRTEAIRTPARACSCCRVFSVTQSNEGRAQSCTDGE